MSKSTDIPPTKDCDGVGEIVKWLDAQHVLTLDRDPLDGPYRSTIDGVQLRALARAIESGDYRKTGEKNDG